MEHKNPDIFCCLGWIYSDIKKYAPNDASPLLGEANAMGIEPSKDDHCQDKDFHNDHGCLKVVWEIYVNIIADILQGERR